MLKSLKWRSLIVLFVLIAALIYLVPSLRPQVPGWWSSVLPSEQIQLGLDLQGGIHLDLEVQVERAVENHLERVIDDLKRDLRDGKIRYVEIRRQGLTGIAIILMRPEDKSALEDLIAKSCPDFRLEQGAEKEGKPEIMLGFLPKASDQVRQMAVDQALETIRNRIDEFGVKEPDIRPQKGNRLLIQLPGIDDPKRAIALIGKTALLEFKLVDEEQSLEEALKGNIPPGDEILYEISVDAATGQQKKIPYLLKKRSSLTGEYITDARVQIDSRYNEPYVSLSFDSRGARIFEQVTGQNIKKRLAIVLDGKVNSAPVIQDKISGGKAQITGRYTMDEARDLALVLRAGALPAPVKIMEERTVGPSLGKDSITKGVTSALIGGVIVMLCMAIYYGLSGVIADVALLLNVVLIMAGLAFFGATLTLPGIAGVILTIGMSLDSNILIFERIREELRLGKTARASIEAGYARATVTILDAQVTTLIAGLVLFQFGTGPVKGFAVTLSIGLVASLFTGIFVTRVIYDYLYQDKKRKTISV